MTRRPVAVRILVRKPEVLLRLRLVPPKVRLVINAYLGSGKVTVYHHSILLTARCEFEPRENETVEKICSPKASCCRYC
jgi:hypothetical protein